MDHRSSDFCGSFLTFKNFSKRFVSQPFLPPLIHTTSDRHNNTPSKATARTNTKVSPFCARRLSHIETRLIIIQNGRIPRNKAIIRRRLTDFRLRFRLYKTHTSTTIDNTNTNKSAVMPFGLYIASQALQVQIFILSLGVVWQAKSRDRKHLRFPSILFRQSTR